MAQETKLPTVLVFFGGALCLIAVFQVAITGWTYWNEKKIQDSWTPAQGEIVAHEIVERTDYSESNAPTATFYTSFTVRYGSHGQELVSHVQIDYGTSNETKMESLAARFPNGTHLKIKYNPKNPAQLVISDEEPDLAYLGPKKSAMWAAIVLAAGAVMLVAGKRMAG